MNRKEKIIYHSNLIAKKLGLKLEDSEYNYGEGIGRADNHCFKEDWLIVFEMEFSQRHPEMNVMKVWPYLESNPKSRILMIQHLIDEDSVSPNRIKLCKWIASKMEGQLKGRFYYALLINDLNEKSLKDIKALMSQLSII